MPDLCIKQQVRVQDEETKRWNKTGTIVQIGKHRQYLVELVNGRRLWRNRKFLRLILREETPQDVDRSGGNIVRRKPPNPVRRVTPHEVDRSSGSIVRRKPPNPESRVTFQDDPDEMVDDQSMKLRSKRGINYRALAGMK